MRLSTLYLVLLSLCLAAESVLVAAESASLVDELYENSSNATCCSSCAPTWTGRVGYVHMWREQTSDVGLVGQTTPIGVPPGPPLFASSDFSFDGRPGMDVSISRDNGCGWGIDFRYLWVDDFSANEQFIALANPQILTTPPTQNLYTAGDIFRMDYTSEIQSAEILGRRSLGRFDLSAGFRYVELNESLLIDPFAGGVAVGEATFNAANDLYGFQLGLHGPLWENCGRFRVDGFTKLGIYYNDIAASSIMSNDFGNPALAGSGADTTDYTSFLMEFGVYGTYDITCNLSVRGGYQLMYIDGVALAADQVPNTGDLDTPPGTATVNAHGGNSVFYHGLNIGLEYRR